jgi:hypothetical protein
MNDDVCALLGIAAAMFAFNAFDSDARPRMQACSRSLRSGWSLPPGGCRGPTFFRFVLVLFAVLVLGARNESKAGDQLGVAYVTAAALVVLAALGRWPW